MQMILTGSLIIAYILIWTFCVAAKQDIGIDEWEEQDNWIREYEQSRLQKLEKKRKSTTSQLL